VLVPVVELVPVVVCGEPAFTVVDVVPIGIRVVPVVPMVVLVLCPAPGLLAPAPAPRPPVPL